MTQQSIAPALASCQTCHKPYVLINPRQRHHPTLCPHCAHMKGADKIRKHPIETYAFCENCGKSYLEPKYRQYYKNPSNLCVPCSKKAKIQKMCKNRKMRINIETHRVYCFNCKVSTPFALVKQDHDVLKYPCCLTNIKLRIGKSANAHKNYNLIRAEIKTDITLYQALNTNFHSASLEPEAVNLLQQPSRKEATQ